MHCIDLPGGSWRLNGSGGTTSSSMQCTNSPCRQPSAISQSVEARARTIRTTTIIPQIKAITWREDTDIRSVSGKDCNLEIGSGLSPNLGYLIGPHIFV